MAKRGPLSEVDKFYLDNHINEDPDTLATTLDRSISFIKKYIKENKSQEETVSAKPKRLNPNFFPSNRGAVVMTEGGSQIGDDTRSKVKPQEQNHIVKIHR
jgi:hypothetical protein